MSAPIPDFDQLLSDHLDGRLAEAETRMLQQQLQDDPAVRRQYDDLVSDRETLRRIFAVNSEPAGLPTDFARRVMTESRRRGLATSEPATDTSTAARRERATDSSQRRARRIAAGVLATAAALLAMVSWNLANRPGDDSVESIAQVPSEPSNLSLGILKPSSLDVATSQRETQPETQSDAPAREAIAGVMSTPAEPPLNAIASANRNTSAPLDPSNSVSVSQDESDPLFNAVFTGAVMVYDVRLTSTGRDSGAFAKLMQRNGLSDADRQPINRDVIASAKAANTFGEDDKFQILYLQASAKKVDRMFLDLSRDRSVVESIGLSLITDAPILKMASALARVNATEVKHDRPLSLELGGGENDEQLETLRRLLGEQAYLPLNAMPGAADMDDTGSPSSSGNDVITRVLILVR